MKFDKEVQREVAKVGMTATLGVTVATSFFMKNKTAKNAHIVAGAAFCGFALWHTLLYDSKSKKNKKEQASKQLEVKKEKDENSEKFAIELNDFFVELSINGKLTNNEFKSFKEKIEILLSTYKVPSMNILIDITQMSEVEFKALWEDIVFTIKHIKELKKIAIVGNNKIEKYSVAIADKIFSSDFEYFSEYSNAKSWLLETKK